MSEDREERYKKMVEEQRKKIERRIKEELPDGKPPERYRYIQSSSRRGIRKVFPYILIIAALIAVISIFWIWPAWFGSVSLQQQLYNSKAGGVDYFDFLFLDFWSNGVFFNKTALIGAIIGCVIMSIPPDRVLLTIVGTRLRFGKPSRIKSALFWWTAGFCLFYLFGQLIDADNQFSWTIYLIQNGSISIDVTTLIPDAFNVLFNRYNMDIVTIFVYTNLVLPIVGFIFGVIIFRIILKLIQNLYVQRNDFNLLSYFFILISMFFGIGIFSLPTLALDGVQLIQIWAVFFGFFGFLILGIVILLYGKAKISDNPNNYIIFDAQRKKVMIMGIGVLIIVLVPLFISAGPYVLLGDASVWTEQVWNKKIQRQIAWTRTCAGLSMFEEKPITDFSESSQTPDQQMVSQVRQYDQDFAVQYLAASIGSTYEGLADSDIVYINNREYWVAPKTVRFSQIQGDAVQTNTELYDHVEGFLAMDTFTGDLVNVGTAFNISENYPIFFGESESQKYIQTTYTDSEEDLYGSLSGAVGAYDSDILLGTEWAKGIPNNVYRYEGDPDGSLIGLEAFWKTVNLGLFAYSSSPEAQNYLINRNIKTRVEAILLPGLEIDNDPYLVFDISKGKMYYVVSIFTYINVGAYSNSRILRFLGVCLIDLLNGDLEFYKNPALSSIGDPTAPLWSIYFTKYNWKTAPSWLRAQLRYPETLFELQLAASYIYHVQDPTTWKRADDFQERPAEGDLFYIESDLGEGIEYVGIDLVEYVGQEAKLLAGMYVVRHGSHFGQVIFYYTRGSNVNLIGPNTARDTYQSEATQDFSLIANARNGNTLLYPIGGSVYYYIPTYSRAGDLQELKLAGFVEAFTREVGYGSNAIEAYENLDIQGGAPYIEKQLTYSLEMESSMDFPNDLASFEIILKNDNTNYNSNPLNIQVVLSVYSAAPVDVDLIVPSKYEPLSKSTVSFDGYNGYNFTVVNTNLYFGEGLTLTGFVEPNTADVILRYKWYVIVDGEIFNTPTEMTIEVT